MFTSSGMLPTANDILFCNEDTPITNIEAFIMRAILFQEKMKSLRAKNSAVPIFTRAFVIANF